MINKIIGFSIHNKLVIGLLVLGLIAWGSYAINQLPIDAVPDITNNQVQVITVAPSLAAQEVERLITFPVEITMATIPSIKEIRSFSRFGLSVVTIVFKEEIDVYWARQQVNERLSEAKNQIPDGIGTPEMGPVTTGLGEIYQYVVHTKDGYENKYSPMELRTIQDWIIKRQLLGTPGVADVSSFGGYLKQYEIAINPDRLRSSNISISDIFTALDKNNQNTGGSYIEKKPNAYFIRSEGMVGSIGDIEKIVVKTSSTGIPILIRDVAKVQFGNAVRYGASTRNGKGEVVSAIVMMLKGENSAQVITNIKERISQIEKTLPEGVVIEPFLDRSKLVDKAIGTVTTNLIEGALIVIFVLILFLGNVRAGLVVASVIPLAMLFAIGMMNLFGVSGNLMSLGAIDFGLIVDGAVIIVESIVHRIQTSNNESGISSILTRKQMDKQVYKASSKIRNSAAFGEIIILIVYLPILALVGIEGKMFKPMAQTVSFAILGAFILSITYVPMMSALVLNRNTFHKRNISDKMMDFLQLLYTPLINLALKRKFAVIMISVALFAVSLFTFSQLGGEFIPSLDEGDFAVETRVMTGSSLSETIETTSKAEKILLDNFPEVKQVVSKIGSGEIPTDPMPVESGDLMIILKDKDKWTSAETREELADKMGNALSVIPGVTFGFQQPIQMRFNELMTGARQDVVIKIYGEDLDILSDYAREIGQLVNTVNGAEDLYVEQITGLPQIQIIYNRDEIAKYGLNIEDVNTVIESAFAGKSAGKVYEGERSFDMVVRLEKAHRTNIDDVSNLYITTPEGYQIPLNQIANVILKDGPNQIQRDDTKRRITVGFNVRNRDVESIVEEIKSKVDENVDFQAGYYTTFGGQFQNLVEAKQRLYIAVPIALLLILTLLFFTFHSLKQSILIFTAIPLSAIGGIFALYFIGMPFSISAGIGFIALFGVSVLNGIVLIAEFNRLKANGMNDVNERVIKGTQVRLRPVLMTALVASLGFLPMALSNSSGAEVQRPLATVVIGGLFTATILTLIVLPVLYVYFEKRKSNLISNTLLLLIGILLLPSISKAQENSLHTLSLDEAISMALENNPTIKVANQEIDLNEEMKNSTLDFGKTQFKWQNGQINSFNNNDNYFEISQTFAFPTVYIENANVAEANIKSSKLHKIVTENVLITQVKSVYYQLAFAKAKLNVLIRLDSIYIDFAKATNLRYTTGESSLLEKTTAETQLMEIRNSLLMAESDVNIYKIQFRTLLNTDNTIEIADERSEFKINFVLPSDSSNAIKNNPEIAYLKQQIKLKEDQYSLQKSKILPDITVGYFNQSIIGNQIINGKDQYFGSSNRFTGFQLGIALPIWITPQLSHINVAEIKTKIAESNYDSYENKLKGMYIQTIQEYLKYKNSLEYYETNALNQSELILVSAQKEFKSGSIGYVEYLQAVNQSVAIQNAWLESLNRYNQSVIQIEYLSGIK